MSLLSENMFVVSRDEVPELKSSKEYRMCNSGESLLSNKKKRRNNGNVNNPVYSTVANFDVVKSMSECSKLDRMS